MRNPFDSLVRWISSHAPTNAARIVMPYLVIVLTLVLVLNLVAVAETQSFATQLRNGLVASCEKNGNPLREAVQRMLREQIQRSEKTPASFFPNIPRAVFNKLIADQTAADRATIRRIRPLNCASLYPRP